MGKNFDEERSLFDALVAEHPEWGPEKSYVVFRDHDLLKDKPPYVERVQPSGLCYMHAPVILQHYQVAMVSEVVAIYKDPSVPTDLDEMVKMNNSQKMVYLRLKLVHVGPHA